MKASAATRRERDVRARSAKPAPPPFRRKLLFEALEPRILLSAAPGSEALLLIPGFAGTQAESGAVFEQWLTTRGVDPSLLQIDPLSNSSANIIRTLENVGYSTDASQWDTKTPLIVANWDWRVPVADRDTSDPDSLAIDGTLGVTTASITDGDFDTSLDYLAYYLQQAADAGYDKVDVIAHSTGGLVARSYIQSAAYAEGILPQIDDLVFVGVPQEGVSSSWNLLHDDFNNWGVTRAMAHLLDLAMIEVQNGATITGPGGDITLANLATDLSETPVNERNLDFARRYLGAAWDLVATYDAIDTDDSASPASFAAVADIAGLEPFINTLLLDLNAGDGPGNLVNRAGDGKTVIVYADETATLGQLQQREGFSAGAGLQNELLGLGEVIGHLPGSEAGNEQVWYQETEIAGDNTVAAISARDLFQAIDTATSDADDRLTLKVIRDSDAGAFVGHSDLLVNAYSQGQIIGQFATLGDATIETHLTNNAAESLSQAIGLGIVNLRELVLDALSDVARLLDDLITAPALDVTIPFIDKKGIEILSFAVAFRSAVNSARAAVDDNMTLEQLNSVLAQHLGSGFQIGFADGELTIDLDYSVTASETVDVPLPGGVIAGDDLELDLAITFNLDLSIGVDLTSTEAGRDMVFIDVDELSLEASIAEDDIDLAVQLGPLAAEIVDGSASLAARLDIGLVDPNDDDKITISELLDGLKHPTDFIDAEVSGALDVILPLNVSYGSVDLNDWVTPTVEIHDADLFDAQAPQVEFLALLESQQVQDNITGLLRGLAENGLANLDVLDQDLPLIGKSINDLIGGAVGDLLNLEPIVQGYFDSHDAGGVNEGERADVTGLVDWVSEALAARIATLFQGTTGGGPGTPVFTGGYDFDTQTLSFDFDFDAMFEDDFAFDLNEQLGEVLGLDLDDLPLLDVELQSLLTLDAFVDLHLGFDLDFSGLADGDFPLFTLDGDTHLEAGVTGEAQDILGRIGLTLPLVGNLGLLIDGGSASIAFSVAASLGGTGRVELGDVADAFQFEVEGDAVLDLPMFFPIKSMPLGGSDQDGDDDNDIADNVLHASAHFSLTDLEPEVFYALPELGSDFDVSAALIALLNDPAKILGGLEGFFDGIGDIADNIDSIELPLIGGSAFDDLAESLRGLRDSVLGTQTGSSYSAGSLGKWLQDRIGGEGIFEEVLDMIRQELFDALSPINGAMFAFLVPQGYDEDGNPLTDPVTGKILTKVPTSPDDFQLTLGAGAEIKFNIMFGGVLVDANLPLDFSAAIPGVGISIDAEDAELATKIDYLFGIGLGFKPNLEDPLRSIFLDTSGINEAGEEAAFDIVAEITAGSKLSGELGFLRMQFEVVGDTLFAGHIGLDIADVNDEDAEQDGDGRWVFGESLSLALNADARAEANLKATVDTVAGEFLPSVETVIRYKQQLGRIELSTASGFEIELGSPEVTLEDVTLDVGSVFENILGDTFGQIYDIVGPMKPVVDLLTTEIDLGFTKVQFIDIAYLKLPAKTVDTAKKVLNVIKSTLEFLEMVKDLADDGGKINFGTFELTESFTEDPDAQADEADIDQGAAEKAKRTAGMTQAQKDSLDTTLKGPDQKGLTTKNSTTKKSAKAPASAAGKNFSIPILDDPMTVLDFIMGKGEATLFYYDLPDLDLNFTYAKTFPVFPGLNVGMRGTVGASTNFDFGFDTKGLREWMDRDFDPAESWRLLNGFFLDDHGLENTEEDQPEITLTAGIAAIASLGIGGLVEAGVEGGLTARIEFDLNDFETAFQGDTPVGDGKLYGSELIERITHGPQCLFDVQGELRAYVEAFLWIGIDLGFSEITLFEARERFIDEVLATFDWECIHDSPSNIAHRDGSVLTLEYGDTDVAQTYTVDVLEIDQNLTLAKLVENGYLETEFYTTQQQNDLRDLLETYRNDADEDDRVIIVSTGVRADVFLASEVDKIKVVGTDLSDRYNFKRLNGWVDEIEIDAKGGDDLIDLVGGKDGKLTGLLIEAGDGDDRINVDSAMLAGGVSAGAYTLSGQGGRDALKITGKKAYGGTLLDGGAGDDTIFGGESGDVIRGGAGFDVIFGYGGDDVVEGGDENAATYLDADGLTQVSRFYQSNGERFGGYDEFGLPAGGLPANAMIRSFHGDVIDGGAGNDEIHGGGGWDKIIGGEGENEIYGDAGNDIIDAGSGPTYVDAGAGDDLISWVYKPFSGADSPELFGGEGDDTLDVVVDTSADGNENVITLAKDTGTTAAFTVDGDAVLLTGVENIKADVGRAGDNLTIEDLLDTDVRTVDLTLGQQQATMFTAERDADGNLLVFPDSFAPFTGDGSVQNTSYFYRYDLATGGRYLVDGEGEPVLESVIDAATLDPASADHSVQEIALDEGLDRVQLVYGEVFEDADGNLVNVQDAAWIQAKVHAAEVVEQVVEPGDPAPVPNAVQRLWLADGIDQVTLFYGYNDTAPADPDAPRTYGRTALNSITLERGDTRAMIEQRLEALDGIDDVVVTGNGTQANPWQVSFVDAHKDSRGAFLQLAQVMTAADVQATLEKVSSIGADHVTVGGFGTAEHPWVVTLLDGANEDAGKFRTLHERHQIQSYIGDLIAQDDTRVFDRIHRLTDNDAEYLFNADGSASVVTLTESAQVVSPSQQTLFLGWQDSAEVRYGSQGATGAFATTGDVFSSQSIGRALLTTGTIISYGGDAATLTRADFLGNGVEQAGRLELRLKEIAGLADIDVAFDAQHNAFTLSSATLSAALRYDNRPPAVELSRGMAVADVEAALESLAGIDDVTVSGAGTEQSPWLVTFISATRDSQGAALLLSSEASVQRMVRAMDEVPGALELAMPMNISTATFRSGAATALVHFTDAATITADLATLAGGAANIELTGTGAANDPWNVRLLNQSQSVTVEYTLDAAVMSANAVGTWQVIERRDADDVWAVEYADDGRVAVYSSGEDVSTRELYITAFRTVDREGPRLIEKDVWADTDGDGDVEKTGATDWFADPMWVTDGALDTVQINGSSARDYFLVGHEVLNRGSEQQATSTDTVQVTHQRLNAAGDAQARQVVITLRGLDLDANATLDDGDQLDIDAGEGDDRLIAGLVPNSLEIGGDDILWARAVDDLVLTGGEGNDWIVGTAFHDVIRSGAGDDTVTGGAAVDTFEDADGEHDTLIEQRDLNFQLTGQDLLAKLRITGLEPALEGEILTIDELEGVADFERFLLYGGSRANNFSVSDFGRETFLDGTEGSDGYTLTLSGSLDGVASSVYVTDSGTGSTDNDTIEIRGSGDADTLHLDADASRQEIERLAAGSFRLTYNGKTTGLITGGAAAIEAALEHPGMGIGDVTVTGSGQAGDPWRVLFLAGTGTATDAEGRFFHLHASDETIARASVARATVTRVQSDLAEALLAGRPDLEAMFEKPANSTQVFNLWAPGAASFKLAYNDELTTTLTNLSSKAEIEAALEFLTGLTDVTVAGKGTSSDPWRVTIEQGAKDSKGGFFLLRAVTPGSTPNSIVLSDLVTPPSDAADAAATTRASISLSTPLEYQRVFYDRGAENVTIHGAEGNDVFISDDSMAAMQVYGDEGDDSFLVGRVLKTLTLNVDTNGDHVPDTKVEVIDGADGITAGVSFNAQFYGGAGEDYFEINHNIGTLQLFGESGNDTFFLKAQLTTDQTGAAAELARGTIVAGAGNDQGQIGVEEKDVLINYVQNNRVEIFGGTGFDTVVVAGTALDDTFYIYTDNDGRQYIYGAGLKIENLDGVERLALVTGAGNDTVYLYGLDERLSLVLGLGSGDDEVFMGGDEKRFNVVYPASSAVYTVGQKVLQDVLTSSSTNFNDVVLKKYGNERSEADRQAAFRLFYSRWIGTGEIGRTAVQRDDEDVLISREHWSLLEANLATGLKLFLQALEKADRDWVYSEQLHPRSGTSESQENAYLANANELEQALLDANRNNVRFIIPGTATIDTTSRFETMTWFHDLFIWGETLSLSGFAVRNGYAPVLPTSIDFETLAGLAPNSGFWGTAPIHNPLSDRFAVGNGDGHTLDDIFFWEYLRPILAYTIWGDHVHGEQVRLGTDLNSPRIEGWGYEPDLYYGDLYSHQISNNISIFEGWMPHLAGSDEVWAPEALLNQPNVGSRMFFDLLSLFYKAEAPKSDSINYTETFTGQLVDGTAAYRFDNMPVRVAEKIMAASYDLDRIAGVVRISGGSGSDTVEITGRSAGEVAIRTQTLHLADYEFNAAALPTLPAGVEQADVQDALIRADKETDIGVLARLASGQTTSTTVQISVDTQTESFELQTYLDSLDTRVDAFTNDLVAGHPLVTALQEFVKKGNWLLDSTRDNSNAAFSLDALDALRNNATLRAMASSGDAKLVDDALIALRGFLTLAAVDSDLRGDAYSWTDSALTVYRQLDPDPNIRTSTKGYSWNVWEPESLEQGNDFMARPALDNYAGRLDMRTVAPNPAAPIPNLPRQNDLPENRQLREIRFDVDGTTGIVNNAPGNAVALNNEYARVVDNLDKSYYSYSNYGVGSDGSRILESVTLRRLNDTEPGGAKVANHQALEGGTYLTAANWASYINGLSSNVQYLKTQAFTEANVQKLITEAFGQVKRTDVKAPLVDGLRIFKNGKEHSVDVATVKDTAGFYLPTKLTVTRSDMAAVTVGSAYVQPNPDNARDVTYDTITGLNDLGLWYSGFENVTLNVNVDGAPLAARVTIESMQGITNLQVNTGVGDDAIVVHSSTGVVTGIDAGDGNDSVFVQTVAGTVSIQGGAGSDGIMLFDGFEDSAAPGSLVKIDGGQDDDLTVLNLGRNTGVRVEVTNTLHGANSVLAGTDGLIINGTELQDVVHLFSVDATKAQDITAASVVIGTGANRERVDYRQIDEVTINTLGGNDDVLSDDNGVKTILNLGDGDDLVRVGTVATEADEFGIPVVVDAGSTPGASAPMTINGGAGNDRFEINHNEAALFLFGDDGDDTFIVNTFLVRRDEQGHEVNLATITGGLGDDRYEYLQNGPVFIDGGAGFDTFVFVGSPADDVMVVTRDLIAGGGRIVPYLNLERVVVDGAGGDDDIYVLSTSATVETTIRGGSGKDTIHLGGDHPLMIFDPPPVTLQSPAYDVEETQTQSSQVVVDPAPFLSSLRIPFFEFLFSFVPSVRSAIEQRVGGPFEFAGFWSGFFFPDVKVRVDPPPRTIVVDGTTRTITTFTPPPVEFDHEKFGFKLDMPQDVSGIQGVLTIDGTTSVDLNGVNETDRLIVHDDKAGAAVGALVSTTQAVRIPAPVIGADGTVTSADGLYVDGPTTRTYLNLTGLGMGSGLRKDGSAYSGVELVNLEDIDIRLGDGNDTFTIGATHEGTTSIVAGGGNDRIFVEAIAGDTAILGGAGNDTLTVTDAGLLDGIGASLTFEGDKHRREAPVAVDPADPAVQALIGEGLAVIGADGKVYAKVAVPLPLTEALLAKAKANPDDLSVAFKTTIVERTLLLDRIDPNTGQPVRNAQGQVIKDPVKIQEPHIDPRLVPLNYAAKQVIETNVAGGDDRLLVSDAANTDAVNATLTSSTLQIDDLGLITYRGLEGVQITLGSGADAVTVESTHGGNTLVLAGNGENSFDVRATAGVTTLVGGNDDDSFHVSSLAGSLDGITGSLIIDAGGGLHNLLVIDDSGDTDADTNVRITNSQITGLATGTITYLAGFLGQGRYGSFYDADSDSFSAGITISAGSGGNTIAVASSRSFGDVEVTRINTGSAADAVTITDADPRYLEIHGQAGDDFITLLQPASASPTIGGLTVFGDEGDDTITGGAQADVLVGGLGSDTISGGAGNDVIVGDQAAILRNSAYVVQRISTHEDEEGETDFLTSTQGNDVVIGGAGSDHIQALDGASIILGDAGTVVFADGSAEANDVFSTTPQSGAVDFITGGQGDNIIIGGAGGDVIDGGAGNEVIVGDGGYVARNALGVVLSVSTLDDESGDVDHIAGGAGSDVILGGAGGDFINASLGGDIILGDAGVVNTGGDIFTTNSQVGGDDHITGEGAGAAAGSILIGGAGADELTGTDGNDIIVGDGGRVLRTNGVAYRVQSADAGGGSDTITGGDGNDVILGGAGGDTITASLGGDIILGDSGDVQLDGEIVSLAPGSDVGGGNDIITGASGGSTEGSILIGGVGDDLLTGTGGDDVIIGDGGRVFRSGGVLSTVETFDVLEVQQPGGGTLVVLSGGDDTITGGDGRDVIMGGLGADKITASLGGDIILGDEGRANMFGAVATTAPLYGGDDLILGGAGTALADRSILIGGKGKDRIFGGEGDNVIIGDGGTVLRGGPGGASIVTHVLTNASGEGDDDFIRSGAGSDIILGGAGSDDIEANGGSDVILGDHGEVELQGLNPGIRSTDYGIGAADTIKGGDGALSKSTIIGGAGADRITTGTGSAVILGDDGEIVRDLAGNVTRVATTGAADATAGADIITSNAGENVIIAGLGVGSDGLGDHVTAGGGANNIILGDDGEVNVGGLVRTLNEGKGGADVIIAGGDEHGGNIILGGFGADRITLGQGFNTVVGDNGRVERNASGVTAVESVEASELNAGDDRIVSLGGENIILGGLGADFIDAAVGSSIVLGDAGRVEVGGNVFSRQDDKGGDDTILSGATNTILGGFGADKITLQGGVNTVVGDNGIVRREGSIVRQVATQSPDQGGVDIITMNGGTNIVIGGVGGDRIDGAGGSNIVLGDNGVANFGFGGSWSIESDVLTGGGADEIQGGDDNIILGGFGADTITLGSGANTVVGDNGIVSRVANATGGATVTAVATSDTAPESGDGDSIDIGGGDNVVLGGVGDDKITIDAGDGTNIVLGDNGSVNVGGTVQSTLDLLGGADQIHVGVTAGGEEAENTILGGFGADQITLTRGNNTVLGDNGIVYRDALDAVTRVETSDLSDTTAGADTIISGGGNNVILGGRGVGADGFGDRISVTGDGDNIILGDDGEVNAGGVVQTRNEGFGGNDVITTQDGDNVIAGGYGDDRITLGEGINTVVGDNAYIARNAAGLAIQVKTTDLDGTTGGVDTITSNGGTNVILGGVGADKLTAHSGSNIILGDNGVVNLNNAGANDVFTTDPLLGGNDEIVGGTGESIILGGAGNDLISGGSGRDIALGDNGIVRRDAAHAVTFIATSDTCIGGDDVITGGEGDNILIGGAGNDIIDGGSGNEVMVGGAGTVDLTGPLPVVTSGDDLCDGADVIHAGSGNDVVWGGGGNDQLYGGLGNDKIYGQGGNDIILGDVGQIIAGKDVLLTDVAHVTGEMALNGSGMPAANAATVNTLLNADVVLLAGVNNADGSRKLNSDGTWASRALLLDLAADGDDTISGGDGDDQIFGQRGNDVLTGDAGNDLVSGGTGNDRVDGGTGNDTVVGDDVTIDSPAATFGNVMHGYLVDGVAVVPALQVAPGDTPNAAAASLATLFGNPAMPASSNLPAAGGTLTAYASVLTDFGHHLGQLNGNDTVIGGAGDDTLVGDDQSVVARTLTLDAAAVTRIEALTRAMLDITDDFSDLVHAQYSQLGCDWWDDHHDWWDHDDDVVVDSVFTLGADSLDGGDGNDTLIGDDSILAETVVTLQVGYADDFERFAEGMADAGNEAADALLDLVYLDTRLHDQDVLVKHGTHWDHETVHHITLVAMGNDTLNGGAGNDLMVGDAFTMRTAQANLVVGGTVPSPSDDDSWKNADWYDDNHHHWWFDDHDHHEWNEDWHFGSVTTSADVINGGAGNDLVWGDSLGVQSSTVTRGAGIANSSYDHAKHDAEDALCSLVSLTDSPDYWLTLQDGGHCDNDYGDTINGGDGDDILFGQAGNDKLRGEAGADWLIGGAGHNDCLDGGSGSDKTSNGNDNSSSLRSAVNARLVNWKDSFKNYGVPYSPFGGLKATKYGGGSSERDSFDFLTLDG